MIKQKIITALTILTMLFHTHCLARDWSSYTSENFTIYSDQRPKKVIELLEEFEVFRGLVLAIIGVEDRPENAKMKILVYSKGREYRAVGPQNTIGFYTNSSAGPRMVVGPDSRTMDKSEILYHEYIHYLLREHSSVIYPRWFDEGFAEVLGATTIKHGKATLGAIPESRSLSINYERPFKTRELLVPDRDKDDSRSYQSRFYAYAWLFTHYLQVSSYDQKNQHLKGQTTEYLARYQQGEDPILAFEDSFGMTPEETDIELKKYRSQKRFTVLTFDVGQYTGEISQKPLSHNEEVFLLSDIAWRVGKEDVALDILDDIDPDKSSAAQALSLAAVLENHNDNIEEAAEYAKQAETLAANDAMVLTNLSHWQWDTFNREGENEQDKQLAIEKTLQYGKQAISNDPSSLEALQFIWEAQVKQGEDIEALRSMMAAYTLAPSSLGINATIGNFLMELDRPKLAQPFMERVLSWTHSEAQRKKIQILLDIIEQKIKTSESKPE